MLIDKTCNYKYLANYGVKILSKNGHSNKLNIDHVDTSYRWVAGRTWIRDVIVMLNDVTSWI